ncbi:dual specificity protein phosphatase 6 [Hydra vulgaris]|uniref:protein-tyrosine-phosphatase n=1 Tax=Hydra vulgaris TaxID=6087 RepID=A0ABM4DIR4_HYDVU
MKIKFETSGWLFAQYQQRLPILLIDCRPFCDYSKAHIEGAINISVPSLMIRRLKKGNVPIKKFINSEFAKTKYDERSRYDKVVIYDERSCMNDNLENTLLECLLQKLSEDSHVVTLNGGFASFEELFPHLCQCGEGVELGNAMYSLSNLKIASIMSSPVIHDSNRNVIEIFNVKDLHFKTESSGPIEILPQLFLGNKTDSSCIDLLRKFNITHILNVTHDLPNLFYESKEFEYLQIPIQDNSNGNVLDMFPIAYKFIENAIDAGGCVLVHCLGGISRSSTIIIAYLMIKYRFSLNEAYDHVKSKKRNIAPNFTFMGQLLDLEQNKCLFNAYSKNISPIQNVQSDISYLSNDLDNNS